MSQDPNRRTSPRWVVEIGVTLQCELGAYETNILNMNLGGCFVEGRFDLFAGDIVYLTSQHNPNINGMPARVAWVVDDPDLAGIGLRFENLDDNTQRYLLSWYNEITRAA